MYRNSLFRQHFFDITLLLNADFLYSHSFQTTRISENILQVVPPRQVQKIIATPEALERQKGFKLWFKPEFLSIVFDNASFLKAFPFFSCSNHNCVIKLGVEDGRSINDLMIRIHTIYQRKGSSTDQIIKRIPMGTFAHRQREMGQGYPWFLKT